MKCELCLNDSQKRYPIIFNSNSVCSGCYGFEFRKQYFDRNRGDLELVKSLVGNQTCNRKSPFDCIVPLNTDGEFFYVLDRVIELELNPLVVSFNNGVGDSLTHRYETMAKDYCNSDVVEFSLAKKYIKHFFEISFSGRQHFRQYELFFNVYFPVLAAHKNGIEYIIFGPNQVSEIAGRPTFIHKNKLTSADFFSFILGDLDQNTLSLLNHICSEFNYPFEQFIFDLDRLKIIFLSDYILWDSVHFNSTHQITGTLVRDKVIYYDEYQSISSPLKLGFFDLMRIIVTGQSKILDYLNRDIRFGRITKEDAREIYNRVVFSSARFSDSGSQFADFFGISPNGLNRIVELVHTIHPNVVDFDSKFVEIGCDFNKKLNESIKSYDIVW